MIHYPSGANLVRRTITCAQGKAQSNVVTALLIEIGRPEDTALDLGEIEISCRKRCVNPVNPREKADFSSLYLSACVRRLNYLTACRAKDLLPSIAFAGIPPEVAVGPPPDQ